MRTHSQFLTMSSLRATARSKSLLAFGFSPQSITSGRPSTSIE